MGLYYRLDYKNNKNHLNQKDSVPVIIDYYYKGKRTKVSTGVVCQIKDWDDNWRKKIKKTKNDKKQHFESQKKTVSKFLTKLAETSLKF